MRRLAAAMVILAPLAAQAPYERIRRAAPADWLTYSGNYQAHRHSALAEITPANVARLRPVWQYQVNDLNQFETSPIAADGRSEERRVGKECRL